MAILGWRKLGGAIGTIVLILVYGWFQMTTEAGHVEVVKYVAYVAIALMAGNGIAAIGNAFGRNGNGK